MIDILITMPTGARPETAMISVAALDLAFRHLSKWNISAVVDIRQWHPTGPGAFPDYFFHHLSDGGYKADLLNTSWLWYNLHTGKSPDVWITLDDDTVVITENIVAAVDLLNDKPEIGLVGAWNHLSELDRGELHRHKYIQYQTGNDFCVGGAFHAIPKRAFNNEPGRYYQDFDIYPGGVMREEDMYLTKKTRDLGYETAIMLSHPVSVLPDDEYIFDYRQRILEMHYQRLDRWK